MSKVKGHLVDMPCDFLIVRRRHDHADRMCRVIGLLADEQEEKWMTEGVGITFDLSKEADAPELLLGQPLDPGTVCVRRM